MSEEKRFTNKKLIGVSIALVLMCGVTGVLGFVLVDALNNNTILSGDYDDLYIDYLELSNDFNSLDNQYFILTGEHIELENDYNILVIELADMTAERDALEIECDELLLDIINLETTITKLNTEITNLGIIIDERDATILDLNTQITTLTAERDALQLALDELGNDMADLEAYYLGLIDGLDSEIATLEAERDGLITDLATMTALRDGLQTDLDAMTLERDNLIVDLNVMTLERDNLQIALDDMTADYNDLLGDYQILFDANVVLQNTYNALQIAYDYICNTIKQSILPVQFSVFAEAVRRYYGDIYLDFHPLNPPKWYWAGFARFCRDIILHDSNQYNSFSVVSNAFSNALTFGNDTMYLAWYIMYWNFHPWLPNWDGFGLTGDEFTDINTIVDWCINEVDYEYDSSIIDGQEYFDWDYIKFPVETAFRTMGDCEDQAILCSAYLESCGLETAIAISHDPAHPKLGEFYHGTLWVHVEDSIAFWTLYPSTSLWSIDGGTNFWCWVDTTWNVPFGSTPTWLQDYLDYNIPLSWDIVSLAFCDIGGSINTNIGENTGLTCVMPT